MFKLKYRRQARNYIARLPFRTKSEIVKRLHELAENPDNPGLDIENLQGRRGFRLRIGTFRVIYVRRDDELVILIRLSPFLLLNNWKDSQFSENLGWTRRWNPPVPNSAFPLWRSLCPWWKHYLYSCCHASAKKPRLLEKQDAPRSAINWPPLVIPLPTFFVRLFLSPGFLSRLFVMP